LYCAVALACAASLTHAAHAQIVNGSFEIPRPNDSYQALGWYWPLWDEEFRGMRWQGSWLDIAPTDGEHMLAVFEMMQQDSITLNAGDRVVFDYALYNNAFGVLGAYVELSGPSQVTFESELIHWSDMRRPMTSGEIVVPQSGVYRLRLYANYFGGSAGEFMVFYDNFRVVPVPAPSAAGLLVAGLACVPMRRRRRADDTDAGRTF
jgi:hypothetical protein